MYRVIFTHLADQVAKRFPEKTRKSSLSQEGQSSKTKLRHSQSYSFESHGNLLIFKLEELGTRLVIWLLHVYKGIMGRKITK